jgi:hypothetical protein
VDKWDFYTAFSRKSTKVVIYESVLERIAQGKGAAAQQARAALEAGKICKSDELRAIALLEDKSRKESNDTN